jgi:hypothetical protein
MLSIGSEMDILNSRYTVVLYYVKNTTVSKSSTVLEDLLHFPFNAALGGAIVDIPFIQEDGKKFSEKML